MALIQSSNYEAWSSERRDTLNDILDALKPRQRDLDVERIQLGIRRSRLVVELEKALAKAFPECTGDGVKLLAALTQRYPETGLGSLKGEIDSMVAKQAAIETVRKELPSRESLESEIKLSSSLIRGEEQTILRESLSSIRSSCDHMTITDIAREIDPHEPLEPIRNAGALRKLLVPGTKRKQALVRKADGVWHRSERFHKQKGLPETVEVIRTMAENRYQAGREIAKLIRDEHVKRSNCQDQLDERVRLDQLYDEVAPGMIYETVIDEVSEVLHRNPAWRTVMLEDVGMSDMSDLWQEVFDAVAQADDQQAVLKKEVDDVEMTAASLGSFKTMLKNLARLSGAWLVTSDEFDDQLASKILRCGLPMPSYLAEHLNPNCASSIVEGDLVSSMEVLVERLLERLEVGDIRPGLHKKIAHYRDSRLDEPEMTLAQYTSLVSTQVFGSSGGGSSGYGGGAGSDCGSSAASTVASSVSDGGSCM